jgi:uncharacterized protein
MSKKVEWHPKKNASNLKKHGISFEEAYTVFFDSNAVEFYDDDNPSEESRFLLLGSSFKLRLLLICYCVREGDTIRIISARKATSTESKEYYT